MLFTQEDLGVINEASAILENSIYIDHSLVSPQTTSVVVNEEINAAIVRFSDIEALSEEYGCDYIDAMVAVAESNEIDPNQLAVAVDEAKIIEDPDIVYELANVVVNPISENSLAYLFCEAMVDAYAESGDEDYLYCISEGIGDKIMKVYDKWQSVKNSKPISILRKGPISGYISSKKYDREKAQMAAVDQVKSQGEIIAKQQAEITAIKKQLDYQSKSWISRKIAALRKVYSNFLNKAENADPKTAGIFKRIAHKILSLIDVMLKKLQHATE